MAFSKCSRKKPASGNLFVSVLNCSHFFSYPDCSSYRFEKYQDLPTRGAHAVEHFNINGSLYLAFANYKTDTAQNYDRLFYLQVQRFDWKILSLPDHRHTWRA